MKTFFKIIALCLALLAAGFVGYSMNSDGDFLNISKTEEQIKTTYRTAQSLSFTASDTYVKPIGRTVFENDVRWLSMSGSGVEFFAEAQYADITLVCDNFAYLSYNHRPRIAVYVDEEEVFCDALSQDSQTVHIDIDKAAGKHTVKILKLSEAMHSNCGIGEISVFAKSSIIPAANKSVKIEFIGDSITTGFGLNAESSNADFSTQTQNFAECYAYLAAKALDADYSAIAFSGYGVVSGYSSGSKNTDHVIAPYYEKAIVNKSFSSPYPLDRWDFSKFAPDVVVINLGVNDVMYCSTAARKEEFKAEYEKLIGLVRWNNPSAHILCTLGDMNDSLYPEIELAVEEYTQNTADTNVSCRQIHYYMGENPIAIQGHPGKESNKIAAGELANEIRSILGIDIPITETSDEYTKNITDTDTASQ